MDYSNRHWVIVNVSDIVSDIANEMLSNAIQISTDSLRKTNDGSKAILKWDGDTPSCFDGMTTYTHSEILIELAKSDWVSDE